MFYLQSALDGILVGGVYATVAVGLSMAFGVMRIINWAHGELLMMSMYISFLLAGLGIDPYLTLLITGPIMFGVGFFMQKYMLNRLLEREAAREPQSVMFFTAGLGMALSNTALLIFGGLPKAVNTPYASATLRLGEIYIPVPKIISFFIAVAFTVALYLFLQRTETGRAVRATSQNRQVAELMGMNNKLIYCLAFGIGIGLVGVSSALLIPLAQVSPIIGATFSFKSFIIVVLGGKGSVPGALLGGFIIGLIEKLGTALTSGVVADIFVFLMFVAILLFKPTGLLSKDRG